MSQQVEIVRRPDGGTTVRIKVSDADFRQAQRGLIAHAIDQKLDNAPPWLRRPTTTGATK